MEIPGIRKRSITAFVVGGMVIGLTLSGPIAASLLIGLIILLCSFELWKMHYPKGRTQQALLFGIAMTIPLLLTILARNFPDSGASESMSYYSAPVIVMCLGITGLNKTPETVSSIIRLGATAMTLFTIPGFFALYLINLSPWVLLGIFLLLWTSDIFAYMVGSLLGKRKIAPAISPGKTWEGFIGGGICTLICSIFIPAIIPDVSSYNWMIIASIVVIFGTLGDFIESAIKRAYGVKDSGTLLPGHGGIWDRFDSLLGSVPWIAIYLILFSQTY